MRYWVFILLVTFACFGREYKVTNKTITPIPKPTLIVIDDIEKSPQPYPSPSIMPSVQVWEFEPED